MFILYVSACLFKLQEILRSLGEGTPSQNNQTSGTTAITYCDQRLERTNKQFWVYPLDVLTDFGFVNR